MRTLFTILMIGGGIILMLIAFFILAAPWGTTGPANSNPRLDYAPLLFVLGLLLAFGSAVVYELIPDRREELTPERRD